MPSTSTDAFKDSDIGYTNLHVPFASIDAYKAVEPWKNFKQIVALNDEEIPETPKCDKPNIIKEGNKFWFECATPGATFKSKVTPNVEEQEFEGSEVVFKSGVITYTLSVYASAEGYEDSDPVTMTLTFDSSDVNKDGTIDVADIATIIDKMAGKDNKPGKTQDFTVNGVSFTMIGVEGGTFQMGSDNSDALNNEKPVHQVTVSSFSIGQTEVTQALWYSVMGTNPSKSKIMNAESDDTRSPNPMISVHSVGNLQYRRQN